MALEAVVAREVRQLGYAEVTVENGRVTFVGDEAAVARANLWLRTSDRVLVKMGQFTATTFEELFQGVRALPWDEWLPEDANFIVQGRSHQSQLSSVPACQAVTEKAIVERLRQRYRREWFPKTGGRYGVEVALLKNEVTLTIDTSGPGLHKRGYRKLTAQAPLKETLAAALVLLSRWHPDRPLMDPFCGSGTIPVEAALIGRNLAPGLHRQFAAASWPRIPERVWREAREEARDLARPRLPLEIVGSEIDGEVLSLAGYHARMAGVADAITFLERSIAAVTSDREYGLIITNPPYGERLGEGREVFQLYRDLGRVSRSLPTWGVFVLTAFPDFERAFGRRAERNRKLYNGRILTYYYQYPGPRPPWLGRREGAAAPEAAEPRE